MNVPTEKKLIKARTGLLVDSPFFGSLALRLELVEDTAAGTAWTNGRELGFDPVYIEGLSMNALKGLLAHEVMHLALCHHTRQGSRDHHIWNVACDHAINHLLVDAGFTLPGNVLLDPGYKGLGAEAIYEVLPELHGAEPTEAGPGEVRPLPEGTTPADIKLEEQQWKIAVYQGRQQAKAMGRSPGPGLDRAIKGQVTPQLDWKVLLQNFVDHATRTDFSWMHPSPRYILSGVYMPGLHTKKPGSIVVAIDTSGSVSGTQLDGFASEAAAMLEAYDTELRVVYADRQVQGIETFSRADLPLTLTPSGGGGTDFRPVFELVKSKGWTPCCLVYLTDLCCSRYPENIPDFPVLWVNTEMYRPREPPFGQVIDMDLND